MGWIATIGMCACLLGACTVTAEPFVATPPADARDAEAREDFYPYPLSCSRGDASRTFKLDTHRYKTLLVRSWSRGGHPEATWVATGKLLGLAEISEREDWNGMPMPYIPEHYAPFSEPTFRMYTFGVQNGPGEIRLRWADDAEWAARRAGAVDRTRPDPTYPSPTPEPLP